MSAVCWAWRRGDGQRAVSYTHLTLPNSDLGEISVAAVSLKKNKKDKKKNKTLTQ